MARTSEARLRATGGKTRDGMIALYLQGGSTNEAILAALEFEFPEYIREDDARRNPKSPLYKPNLPDFDRIARQRAQEAIRSTRKQMTDTEASVDAVIRVNGGESGVKPLSQSEMENLHRFSCGVPSLDYIYGRTKFVHLDDDLTLNRAKRRLEGEGRWIKGDPMIPDLKHEGKYIAIRERTGKNEKVEIIDPADIDEPADLQKRLTVERPLLNRLDVDLTRQLIENGMPEAFLSIWAGSPGVGKSRLAISLAKALNRVERALARESGLAPRPVIYYNGEVVESQFRQWAGSDIDPELFLASHDELIRTESIVHDIYQFRPRVVIVDSLQMIAEVKQGSRGTEGVLSRFKLLKADPDAGKPHIVFISQLNKKEEMMGSRYLEHMVDFVAKVTRYEGRKGQFLFECTNKNRGGETPRGAIFRHLEDGIECVSTDYRQGGGYLKLVQPSAPVVVPAAVAGASARIEEPR